MTRVTVLYSLQNEFHFQLKNKLKKRLIEIYEMDKIIRRLNFSVTSRKSSSFLTDNVFIGKVLIVVYMIEIREFEPLCCSCFVIKVYTLRGGHGPS